MPNILGDNLIKMSNYYKQNKLKDENLESFYTRFTNDKIILENFPAEYFINFISNELQIEEDKYSLKEIEEILSKEKNIRIEDINIMKYGEIKKIMEEKTLIKNNLFIKNKMSELNETLIKRKAIKDVENFNIMDFVSLTFLVNILKNN